MIASITAFFTALTSLSKSFELGVGLWKDYLEHRKKLETESFLRDSALAFKALSEGPSTPQAKDEAAKKLSELIRRL